MEENKGTNVEISDREKLATRKIMESLVSAAYHIEEATDWAQELSSQYDWCADNFGFDRAAHGICAQIIDAYRWFCEAHGIEMPEAWNK